MKKIYSLIAIFISIFSLNAAAEADSYFEKITKNKTNSGFEYLHYKDKTLPIIYLNIAFKKAGYSYDPKGKEGIAYLLSRTLLEGAGDFKSNELAIELDKLATSINFKVTRDDYIFQVKTLSKNITPVMNLLEEILKRPHIATNKINKKKKIILQEIGELSEKPDFIARAMWENTVFNKHPYENTLMGSYTTLTSINQKDLRLFVDKKFNNKDMVVTIVGDINIAEFSKTLDSLRSRIDQRTSRSSEIPDVVVMQKPQNIMVDKNTDTAFVYFGMKGIDTNDPDYYAANILNNAVGASPYYSRFSNLLMKKYPFVYNINTFHTKLKHSTVFGGYFLTINKNSKVSLNLLLNEMNDIQENGITKEEFDFAKEKEKYAIYEGLDKKENIVNYLSEIELKGLSIDFLRNYAKNIDDVKYEDVNRVAKRFFNISNLTSVIIGKLGDIETKN